MSDRKDPLWNPDAPADEDLDRIQEALSRFGAHARQLRMPAIRPRASPRRRRLGLALAAGIALLVFAGGFEYRLSWHAGAGWATTESSPGASSRMRLEPGETIATSSRQSARIAVARIGRIVLSPDSRLQLVETRTGRHRVALESGHLRARIWAPAGYFAVEAGSAEVVDLGCDFDMWKRPDGTGRVEVRSGWVSYRIGNEDVLVPEGHGVEFANGIVSTPMRPGASREFADALKKLDLAMRPGSVDAGQVDRLADEVARRAADADAFSLLSLLTRRTGLAGTGIYPRLARALHVAGLRPEHREAWAAGNKEAINEWWDLMPRQPKTWLRNWSDMFD